MGRLNEIADTLRKNASNIKAPEMLDKLSEHYTLRKRPSWREYHNETDENGEVIRNAYLPHLCITPSAYARTKKCFAAFREQIRNHFGRDFAHDSLIWEDYLLLFLEHAVREMKIEGDHIEVVSKMMLPLPKEEWLVNVRKGKKEKENGK